MTAGWRSHVAGARPPVVAMAAAGSSVVRRVEELGDLAQAHIQQLSEAAGEDGEGAGERGAGGPAGHSLKLALYGGRDWRLRPVVSIVPRPELPRVLGF